MSDETEKISPIEQRAKDEKARKEIAESIRDQKKAEMETTALGGPTSTTKGLTGAATLEKGAGYYAEVLAYRSLSDAAKSVVDAVAGLLEGNTILLTDKLSFTSVAALHSLISLKLNEAISAIDAALGIPDEPENAQASDAAKPIRASARLATIPTILATLGAAVDIASFFKTNVDIKHRMVSIPNRALLVEVARILKSRDDTKNKKVFVPGWGTHTNHSLVDKIGVLLNKRQDLQEHRETRQDACYEELDELAVARALQVEKRKELNQLVTTASTDAGRIKKLQDEIDKRDQTIGSLTKIESQWKHESGRIDNLIAEVDVLVTAVTSNAKGELSPIESVADYDLIATTQGAEVLHVEIASQGAEVIITKRAIVSDRINYTGGVIAIHFLTSNGGDVRSTGTHAHSRTDIK